jgi:hypothetical protein
VCESTTRAFTTEGTEDHRGKASAAKDTTVPTKDRKADEGILKVASD